jgi:subtilisin family serine protease
MRNRPWIVCFLLLLLVPVTAHAAVGNDVARAMEDQARIDEDGRLAVWVFFSGRSMDPAGLDDAAARLSSKARKRRVRSMQHVVDQHDLPVDDEAVARIVATGASLRRTSRFLNAASFDATPDQIEVIAGLPGVERVALVAKFRRRYGETDRTAWKKVPAAAAALRSAPGELIYGASGQALEQVNVPLLHERGLSGAGVTIALFDTGFELTHECLWDVDVSATWDFVDEDPDVGQQPGDPEGSYEHGTEMLGIIGGFSQGNLIGAAYGASFLLARTEDIGGETQVEEDNWIAALEWAESLGADVVSSSVGYYDWYWFDDLDGRTAAITIAADLAALRGVSIVTSAGNERRNADWGRILAPADGFNVIAVGGVDPGGFVYPLSSPGPTADGRVKPDVM